MNKIPAFSLRIIIYLVAATIFAACSSEHRKENRSPDLDSMKVFWYEQLSVGNLDTVVERTRPFLHAMEGRSDEAAAHAALQMAQSFTLLEQKDSARHYMQIASPPVKRADDPMVRILYHHIRGSLSLKYSLDYAESITSFFNGYREAKDIGQYRAMVTMLSNIGYIYYVLDDPHGIEYTREALETAQKMLKSDTVCMTQAMIGHALMLTTNMKLDSALQILDSAADIINDKKLNQLAPLHLSARGDVLVRQNKLAEAEKSYMQATRFFNYSEPSFAAMTLLGLGTCKERRGEKEAADSIFRKALEISQSHDNLEFRANILLALAKLHTATGHRDEALSFSTDTTISPIASTAPRNYRISTV